MKTLTHFFTSDTIQFKPLCKKLNNLLFAIGALLWSPLHLSQQQALSNFIQKVLSHVTLAVKIGLIAVRAHFANKSYLVGDIFLMIGGIAIFFHQVFNEATPDHLQHYGNYFHLFYTLRPFIMLVCWSVTSYCYSTSKSGLIIFTVLHSAGWLGIIHYSFFVHDYYSYHSWPIWSMWVLAAALGIGFMLAVDHLVYIWSHKKTGNHARLVGVAEMDMPFEKKDEILRGLANEYREMYKQI